MHLWTCWAHRSIFHILQVELCLPFRPFCQGRRIREETTEYSVKIRLSEVSSSIGPRITISTYVGRRPPKPTNKQLDPVSIDPSMYGIIIPATAVSSPCACSSIVNIISYVGIRDNVRSTPYLGAEDGDMDNGRRGANYLYITEYKYTRQGRLSNSPVAINAVAIS